MQQWEVPTHLDTFVTFLHLLVIKMLQQWTMMRYRRSTILEYVEITSEKKQEHDETQKSLAEPGSDGL